MAIVVLPGRGEIFVGPRVRKFARCTFGALIGDVLGIAQATYSLFTVPAGVLVLNVMCYTLTAWTASVVLNIGDSAATNGWLATAKVAPTSAQTNGIVKSSSVATADTYAGGKYYAAASTIDAIITVATPAVGLTYVWVEYAGPDVTTL